MKRINKQQIIVPLEFSVACAIYKVEMVEVLQVFANHVTLYDTMREDYCEGFSEATRTVGSYVRAKRKRPVESKAMKNCGALLISCLSKIKVLATKKAGMTVVKREETRPLVNMIFEKMERVYTISDTLYLDEYSAIKLNKDFCVLCEAHNCYPKEFLEYFMGRISAADAHAHKGLKLTYDNFTFSLFSNIAEGFGGNEPKAYRLTEPELNFFGRMEELHLGLYIIRDLEERTNILREIYLAHYLATTQN